MVEHIDVKRGWLEWHWTDDNRDLMRWMLAVHIHSKGEKIVESMVLKLKQWRCDHTILILFLMVVMGSSNRLVPCLMVSHTASFLIVNDQTSEAHEISACLPQGSFFSYSLFLFFFNNLPRDILRSSENTYADDTPQFMEAPSKIKMFCIWHLISHLTEL